MLMHECNICGALVYFTLEYQRSQNVFLLTILPGTISGTTTNDPQLIDTNYKTKFKISKYKTKDIYLQKIYTKISNI